MVLVLLINIVMWRFNCYFTLLPTVKASNPDTVVYLRFSQNVILKYCFLFIQTLKEILSLFIQLIWKKMWKRM